MNFLVDSYATWLADFYVVATLLLAAAIVVSAFLQQPAQKLAIAKSALIGLLLLAVLGAVPGWSMVHLAFQPQQQAPKPRPNGVPAVAVVAPSQPASHTAAGDLEEAFTEFPIAAAQAPHVTEESRQYGAISWPAAFTVVHLLGACGVAAWLLVGSLAAHRLRRSATPVSPELATLFAEFTDAKDIGKRRPELLVSNNIDVAVALGIWQPLIILPADWVKESPLPPGTGPGEGPASSRIDVRSILAHECAHVRHRDLHWLAASRTLMLVLWAQPLYWLLRRRMRLDQEALADAAAAELTSREHYAEQLVACVRHIVARPAWSFSAAVGLWESPSQLRKRVALLVDDQFAVLRHCPRVWRIGSLISYAMAALALSLFTLTPAMTESPEQNSLRSKNQASGKESGEQPIEIPVVIAQHVLLLDGREIVTWDELEEKIAALPEPSLARPHFYVTRGAREAGLEQPAKTWIYEIHRKYNLKGHSEGSLWPRADLRYDHIRNKSDLLPDEESRMEGVVTDRQGRPVEGAEVVLVLPADESIPYKTHHIAIVNGRLRNRLEDIVTVSNEHGRFVLHPPKAGNYYVVALHPTGGFNAIRNDSFTPDRKLTLLPWAELETLLGPKEGAVQTASIHTRIPHDGQYPEIVFDQYWSDLKDGDPTTKFGFTHVPPIFETSISRDFEEAEGTAIGLTAASVSLLPGESRRIDLGPLSDKQREWLKAQRDDLQKRLEESRQPRGAAAPTGRVRVQQVVQRTPARANRPPALLSYGDGKPDGKKSYGGSGHMIRFELPEGVEKVRGLRIHGSRYGLPQAPDEDFEITFLSEDRDETLHTEAAPYRLFKRGKESWVRVLFEKEVELPPKLWVALNFNPHQTKGIYLSYDTSTKGEYSRRGLPGDEDEPQKTDFNGDWMVQIMLPRPAR